MDFPGDPVTSRGVASIDLCSQLQGLPGAPFLTVNSTLFAKRYEPWRYNHLFLATYTHTPWEIFLPPSIRNE